ncbi:potassium-transporting ATPase subunit KdpC [Methylomonas montana]|uniref:potassium-transporting ATPase subunit KdpC n=1 Tax=Methylomonas montana TaxID=3058963 RepID=UPI002658E46E|nr:potassium-transporting ATPase subunit KdpC [Methylomonas montana]WKJ91706.1 potassium-transporting ATPase subunit KdpC [Methylomonas montana]
MSNTINRLSKDDSLTPSPDGEGWGEENEKKTTYLKPAAMMLLLLTLVTGAAYPALVTVLAQALFSDQANGSLIKDDKGQMIGSELIGQTFSEPKYFWSRPSATGPYGYNAAASSGSNLGPTNPALVETVASRVQALKDADPNNRAPVPVDLITASASGLDPHISVAAAEYQIKRVAKIRKINAAKLQGLVDAHTEGRQWQVFGEPRVNVLKLNLALDQVGR